MFGMRLRKLTGPDKRCPMVQSARHEWAARLNAQQREGKIGVRKFPYEGRDRDISKNSTLERIHPSRRTTTPQPQLRTISLTMQSKENSYKRAKRAYIVFSGHRGRQSPQQLFKEAQSFLISEGQEQSLG